jgi:hypothetical protein
VLGLLPRLGLPLSTTASLFAANNNDGSGLAGGACCMIPLVLFGVVLFLGIFIGWKLFTKAGRPGWESIVPYYNQYILVTEICKLEPLYFFLVAFVPIANIYAWWVISQALAKKFGKSDGFGIGLFLLPPIFAAMLAFGDAKYKGRRASEYDDEDDEDEDDEDEDDRPRKKRSRDDDEDEEDAPPRKKPVRDEEDEDDRPRKKRPRDEDEDEDDRPRKKRRNDDD